MKIKSLQLKNFKRFADLTLQDIPDNTKLVLLIGTNGSGKSSVFDAFELISDIIHGLHIKDSSPLFFANRKQYSYYHKGMGRLSIDLEFSDSETIKIRFNSDSAGQIMPSTQFSTNLFYGRSAVRYLPKITRTTIGQSIDISKDSDRPLYFIDEDKRFENDIDLLIKDVVENIFKGINSDNNQKILEVRFFLDKINEAFPRIFGTGNRTNLVFKSFVPPAEGRPSRLIFQKGTSELDYDLLSAGEKEVINLLFNLFVRNKTYNDTIYFMDEIDTHLNTALQELLLKEITENWIPDNCQIWAASHSLGFIHYAQQSEHATIFDFDNFDFDYSKVLIPAPKDDPDIYEIAVGRNILPVLFKSFVKIFVENKDGDNYYSNLIIGNFLFVKRKDKKAIYDNILSGDNLGLIDRDFLSEQDISILEKAYKNLRILKMYSVENYLFHPYNLIEYCSKHNIAFNDQEYVNEILAEKENIRHELFAKISDSRQTYPFGKEIDPADKSIQVRFSKSDENRKQIATINKEIDSPDFDNYYKHIPMKNYLTQLSIRKTIPKTELSKTDWFKTQIEEIIKSK